MTPHKPPRAGIHTVTGMKAEALKVAIAAALISALAGLGSLTATTIRHSAKSGSNLDRLLPYSALAGCWLGKSPEPIVCRIVNAALIDLPMFGLGSQRYELPKS